MKRFINLLASLGFVCSSFALTLDEINIRDPFILTDNANQIYYMYRTCDSITADGKMDMNMSILKSDDGDPNSSLRFTYSYENPLAGKGRFIHTYMNDGNPLPSYEGEPTLVDVNNDDIDTFTNKVWNALNEDNKVSLFVRYIDIATGKATSRIINKNK